MITVERESPVGLFLPEAVMQAEDSALVRVASVVVEVAVSEAVSEADWVQRNQHLAVAVAGEAAEVALLQAEAEVVQAASQHQVERVVVGVEEAVVEALHLAVEAEPEVVGTAMAVERSVEAAESEAVSPYQVVGAVVLDSEAEDVAIVDPADTTCFLVYSLEMWPAPQEYLGTYRDNGCSIPTECKEVLFSLSFLLHICLKYPSVDYLIKIKDAVCKFT